MVNLKCVCWRDRWWLWAGVNGGGVREVGGGRGCRAASAAAAASLLLLLVQLHPAGSSVAHPNTALTCE